MTSNLEITNNLKKIACMAIDEKAEDLYKLSQEIWNHPELKFEEHHAHKTLTNFFKNIFSKTIDSNFLMETAFKASFQSKEFNGVNGAHVAIMCEYDALPGIGHACGHNLIAEAGAGAIIGIIEALKAGGIGRVSVFGTPGEEGGGGKIPFIENGVFKDVDIAMMVHPANYNSVKCQFLARKTIKAVFRGKASHASSAPWDGINALDAAVQAYNAISNYRQQMQSDWRVHGIITNGGTKPNIIPEISEIQYYIRAPNTKELGILETKVKNCMEGAAITTGCKVEIIEIDKYYKNFINNNVICNTYINNYKQLLNIEMPELKTKSLGSTDMGNVSHVLPSIHPIYAIPTEAANHTREFTVIAGSSEAQAPTILQAKLIAMTAIDFFQNKQLVDDAKNEFKQQINN